MRLYKPTYKSKKGVPKEVKIFWIEVVDKREQGFRKTLRFATGTKDKKLAEDIGNRIERLVEYATIDRPNIDDTRWLLDNAPRALQDKLVSYGLLPKKEKAKPLIDYLPEFKKTIKGQALQAGIVSTRIEKIIKGCKFETWKDVTAEKFNYYIESRPDGMSQQTAHFYVQVFRRFNRWLYYKGHADRLLDINSVPVSDNHYAAFEEEEIKKLLETVINAPTRYGLTGYQRYLVYLLVIDTAFRRSEIRTLTPTSFNFKEGTVFVKGKEKTKHKKDLIRCISNENLPLFENYIKGKMPTVQLFPIHDKSSKMIKEDCKDAGISLINDIGQKKVFHSTRHSSATFYLRSGEDVETVRIIMGHKDIKTTQRYLHSNIKLQKAAVNKRQSFTVKNSAEQKNFA